MNSFNSEQSHRKYSTVGTEKQYKVMHDLFQSHREVSHDLFHSHRMGDRIRPKRALHTKRGSLQADKGSS